MSKSFTKWSTQILLYTKNILEIRYRFKKKFSRLLLSYENKLDKKFMRCNAGRKSQPIYFIIVDKIPYSPVKSSWKLLYQSHSKQQLMSLNTEQGMDEAQQRKHALHAHRMKNALFSGKHIHRRVQLFSWGSYKD